jgi:hypothetical protein
MKKVLFALSLFLVACTPVRVIETTTTDSTGKQIKVKTKYYQQTDGVSVEPSVQVIATPVFGYPYYTPYLLPRVVVPVRIGGGYRGGFRGRH